MAGKVSDSKNKQEILQLIQFIGNRLVTKVKMGRTPSINCETISE